MDVDALVAKYRQACADAGIVPMPDDEAADRLREVWAALEGSGLRDAQQAEGAGSPH